jgi:MFS family permease
MDNKTEMGLLLIIIGTVLILLSTLGSIAAGASGAAAIVGLLGFFAAILLLVGIILMLVGRKEFGEEHHKFVKYAFVAFVLGIIIIIIGTILMVAGAISAAMEAGVDGEEDIDYSLIAEGMTTGLIVIQVGGIVILIGEVLLVYKLENDLGRNILHLALVIGIIVSIVSTYLISQAMSELMDELDKTPEEEHEEVFDDFSQRTNVIGGLGLISSVLLLIGYIIPYQRIKKGELKPVTFPTGPYGQPPYPPPYPGTYPPQYPYQPYPPYQQPPYPPTGPPPGEGGPPPEGGTPPGPSAEGAVQPTAVPSEQGIINCPHCGTQIPAGSTVCPVCKKSL